MKFAVVLFGVLSAALAVPLDNEDSVSRLVVGTFVNCMNSDMSLCLKEHALKASERISSIRQLKLTDSLTLINNGHKEARSLEPLSSELEVRRQQVSQRLWDSTSELLRNSDLEYSFADDEDDKESRAIDDVEGRGKKKEKKKKLKLLLSLALLAKVKAAALALLFLGVIAASLYKIALIVKIAFIAKLIAIFKALLAKKHEHEDHGWTPHQEEHGHGGWDSGSSGWSRSRNEAQNLAYSSYKK